MSEDETSAYSGSRSSEEDDSELDLGFNNGNRNAFFTGEGVSPESNGRASDDHIQHVDPEIVQHTAMSLLSSDEDEDGENEDDSQESQGNEPTAENIPTASICVNHNTLSPDPLYASIAQSSAMDEGPSILLSNSFDDDDDEDDTDGEEAHQAEGIARDVVHGSDDENGDPHEQDDEALSDAHVVELPHDQPDILVGSIEAHQEDLMAAEHMQEGGDNDDERVDEVIIQGDPDAPSGPRTNNLPTHNTVQTSNIEEVKEPSKASSQGLLDDVMLSEVQQHEAAVEAVDEGLEPTLQVSNGEKETKSSESIPKQTSALAEIEEDLLDYEEDDLLDIEIKDICTSDPDASDIKKAKTVHTPIPVPGHSKHKNALEVSRSADAARKALNGTHGMDSKQMHASTSDIKRDPKHSGPSVASHGGVKRKREPIPAPPPSRGGVSTNIDTYGMDGFEENLLITVQDKVRKVVKKGRFSIEKWRRLISNCNRNPGDQAVEYRSSDNWKNCRVVELKSSKVKVFQMDLQPDLKIVIEGEPLDSYVVQQDIILPDPRYIGNKDYDRGIERAQGFLDLHGKKQLMGYTTNIRHDVLRELGLMDLRGVQDVQRHVLERLRELKSKKSGLSAVLYCKQLSDDKDYDLGCRRLHAFVNDQALKRRLLDCSTAKRRYVLATFGKVPFQLIEPCPGDYLVKLIEDRSSSSVKARTSPQANRNEPLNPALHPSSSTASKNIASNDGHGKDKSGKDIKEEKKVDAKRRVNVSDVREERKNSREGDTQKPRREPIPVPPKRTLANSSEGLKRSPRRRKEHPPVRSSKDSTSRKAGSPSHRNHQPIPSPPKPTRRVVQAALPSRSRMDSMLDSRPQTVARYDLNQTQRHVVPSWNGGNEAMMGQIRSQNIQQQQGLQFVAGVNQQGIGGALTASVQPFQPQQALLMMQQQIIQPQVQQPNSTLLNQANVLNAPRQTVQNPMNHSLAQLQAAALQSHPQISQLPGLLAVQPTIQQRPNLRLKSGGFLCADPARSEEPHPLMQLNEDAFFVCNNAIAVADGLGGTLQYGVSSAEYSRSLAEISAKAMQNLIDESNGHAWTPKVAIEYACSRVQAQGSSTLCLLAFDPQQSILHAGKIGDGGYVVLRPVGIEDMEIVSPWIPFKDPNEHPMGIKSTHYLTSPVLRQQIGGVHPNHAIESQVRVQEGDVVVLATDGFFDVIYVHGEKGRLLRRQIRRLGMVPEMLARQLADLARHFAASNTEDCPICEQARMLDDRKTAAGVQPDDIAVVVAHVVKG